MSAFIVIVNNPELLHKNYENVYHMNDNAFLVKANTLCETIAKNAGITEGKEIKGVVFKLTKHHTGYYKNSLWEWLDD